MTTSVRREGPGDVPVVRDIVFAAFGSPAVPRLLDELRRSPSWLDLSFVAERDGAVVGHVSYVRGWVDCPDRLEEVLVLSPLSVRPDQQHRGVGTALVHDSLALLRDRHEPVVFLEGDPRYYSRLGFQPAAALGFVAPSVRIPPAAFQAVVLPSYHRRRAELSGALVYPDVFWRHDSVGLRT